MPKKIASKAKGSITSKVTDIAPTLEPQKKSNPYKLKSLDMNDPSWMHIAKKDKELIMAVHYCDEKWLERALKTQANAKVKIPENNRNLLMHACKQSCKDVETVSLLVKSNQFKLNDVDDRGWTALHYAANNADNVIMSYLLKQPKIDPNIQDADGHTPLMLLLKSSSGYLGGCSMYISALLSHPKIDVTVKDHKGDTAIDYAKRYKQHNFVRLLQTHGEAIVKQTVPENHVCQKDVMSCHRCRMKHGFVNMCTKFVYELCKKNSMIMHRVVSKLASDAEPEGCDIEEPTPPPKIIEELPTTTGGMFSLGVDEDPKAERRKAKAERVKKKLGM